MINFYWTASLIIIAAVLGIAAILVYKYVSLKKVSKNSFKQSLDLTGLPIITFYQGDKKLNFLIDTGSTGCHIDSRYVPKDATPAGTTSVFGMEGNSQQAHSYFLNIYLNDRKYVVECLASNLTNAFNEVKSTTGVTLHGILGSNFFKKYNYIIDFEEFIFYTNKK